MNTATIDILGKPKPVQYGVQQWGDAAYIGRRNRKSRASLAREGLDMLIRATELNDGAVPLLEQIQVKRLRHNFKRISKR